MAITARTYAQGGDLPALEAEVAAAIVAELQPVGSPTYGNGLWVQPVDAGTAPGSIEDVQADVAELQAQGAAPTAITADGAITIANRRYVITKAGVAALTLAAPSAPQAGTTIEIIKGTANAHVITATGLLDDGVTGGSKNTATFAAFVGANITLVAYNLKWVAMPSRAVTIAA